MTAGFIVEVKFVNTYNSKQLMLGKSQKVSVKVRLVPTDSLKSS